MVESEWVDAYFDHGVDVENRRIFLGDIDHGTIDKAIKGLYLMETADKDKPVELFISSYGGTIYDALALCDIIGTLKCPVHTFSYGKCMSAAVVLVACGERGHRWVAPHVSFMHHDWSDELEGKGREILASVKHNETIGKQWTQLLASKSNKDFKWWDARGKKASDFYFGAEEALEWGVADQIWVEKQAVSEETT